MAYTVKRVDYFYTTITEEPEERFQLLTRLAELGVNLLAFTAVPVGPMRVQFALFPAAVANLEALARQAGLVLDGPHAALLVQGDDELGALSIVHRKLSQANVDVYASSGVTDGKGRYGYVIYVTPDQIERAVGAMAG
jgi:hypothetical protein